MKPTVLQLIGLIRDEIEKGQPTLARGSALRKLNQFQMSAGPWHGVRVEIPVEKAPAKKSEKRVAPPRSFTKTSQEQNEGEGDERSAGTTRSRKKS